MKEPKPLPRRRAGAEDVAIGQKLRALRLDRGLSQGDLAEKIGLTFQQLQKYEKGANRISAGRLVRIAAALNVPVTAFYRVITPQHEEDFSYLRSAGAVRLVRAYAGMGERASKYALLTIAEALGAGGTVARIERSDIRESSTSRRG